MDIVRLAINNARLTISVLVFLLLAGWVAYQSTPKEAEPDVPIPMMYISLIYQAFRLRIRSAFCCGRWKAS